MSQQTFDHSTVRDSARAHFGNSYHQNYYGTVHQNAASDTPLASGTPSSKIRDALKFDGMDMRRATIKLPHGSTCQWFFDSPEYRKWREDTYLEEHHGFLWIRGKPGTGKSTLMRLAVKYADRSFPEDLRISFFFNAKGLLLERSIEGMYRSLLHQVLVQCPALESHFHQVGHDHATWPVELLEEYFRDCVLQLGTGTLTCHIDALDECEESHVRGLVEFFEGLGSMAVSAGVQMRVCFASRHYPRISISRCVHLVLDGLKGHRQDIETYVRSNLKVAELALRDQLVKEITARSHDIFLWVVLVVRLLNRESDRGGNDHALRAQLNAIPSGLYDLFEDAVIERGVNDGQHVLPILLWMVFSQKALPPLKLYHAVLYTGGDTSSATVMDHMPDTSQIERFILNASKGLAELTVPESTYDRQRVQFIHETVREYLRDGGIGRLGISMCNNPMGLSHDTLKTRCFEYITLAAQVLQQLENSELTRSHTFEDRRAQMKSTLPFLHDALEGLVTHAELAQIHGVSQVSFVDAFPCALVIRLANSISDKTGGEYYPSATKTYIFASLIAPQLLQLELNRLEGGGEHRSRVDAGLVSTAISSTVLDSVQGYFGTPLQAASYTRSFDTIKLLLGHGSDVNATGGTLGTALETAAKNACDLDIFELFFRHGADVAVRGGGRFAALQYAATRADVGMMRLLWEHGADINAQGERGGSALQTACLYERFEVVKFLVEHGANVNAKGVTGGYGTALQTARIQAKREGIQGNQEIVNYLLEHGARDDDGKTPILRSGESFVGILARVLLDWYT
jgi:hypothetical protein